MRRPLLILLLLFSLAGTRVHAQLPKIADSRLGLDMVRLTGGQRLYGFRLAENADGSLDLAVERAWLQRTQPNFYEQQQAAERQRLTLAREQLESRIETWLTDRQQPADVVLRRFLESELARLRGGSSEAQISRRFMVLALQPDEIQDVQWQQPAHRQIAGLAYQFELEDVVTTPVKMLQRRLLDLGIDVESEVVDLTEHVPAWQLQSERQWAAKKALVEYQLREPLEYHGTGDKLVRKSAAGQDFGEIIGGLLGDSQLDTITQLGAELGLPEFKQFAPSRQTDWWNQVTREAEADGFLGVLVMRLEQHLLSPQVRVETTFFARTEAGSWFVVFRTSATENANSQSSAQIERIKQDPQVRQVVETLQALGLDVDNRLEQAWRHGAATQRAMNFANGRFNSFLARGARAVDGLPVRLPSTPVGPP